MVSHVLEYVIELWNFLSICTICMHFLTKIKYIYSFFFVAFSCGLGLVKIHLLWEGHKIFQNLHHRFDSYYIGQIYSGDFPKFCGLLRIYELYKHLKNSSGYNILKLQKDGAQWCNMASVRLFIRESLLLNSTGA